MPALDLVYNPVSGSFSDDHLEALRDALIEAGFRVTPMPTTADGARLSGEADLVCVHGGDGTLRDTVQALGERAGSMPICVAPSGTINLVARELGYPRSPQRFAGAVREAWDRGPESWVQSPLYRLGDMPIVSCVSIGPDSHAVARVDSRLKQRIGRYAYVVALAQQMREWPRDTMTIRGELADGERFEYEAEAAIVSHAASACSRWHICSAWEIIARVASCDRCIKAFAAAFWESSCDCSMGLAAVVTRPSPA